MAVAVAVEAADLSDSALERGPHTRSAPGSAPRCEDSSGSGGGCRDPHRGLIHGGLVSQVRPEPMLRLGHRHASAGGVILDLVAVDPPNREVARLGVCEVDAAHA